MRKKFASLLMVVFVLCMVSFACTACNSKTVDASVIMSKAVQKIDYVSEMMFSAIEESSSGDTPFSSSEDDFNSAFIASENGRFSANTYNTSFSATQTIPSDITYSELWFGTVMERQIYVNYVYNVVDYLLQNKLIDDNNIHEKFNTNEIIFGKANKILNQELNKLFLDPTVEKPTMAIRVDQIETGIHFVVDWDWRGQKIATVAPMFNTIIFVDGIVEYDQQKDKVKKITMTWQFALDNEIIMATIMDFNKNEFYFIECYREEIWNDCSDKESIVELFNNGQLTFEKLSEYQYSGIMLVKSNITLSLKDLDFTAMWKQDSDLNSMGLPKDAENDNEARFANLYDEIYEKVKCLKIRNENDLLDLSTGREISYMGTATEYGLNKIEYVVNDNGVHFLYLEQKELNSLLSKVEKSDLVKNDEEFTAFVNGIKGSLNAQGKKYIGKLGLYNGVEYTTKYIFKDVWWETDWSHQCEKFYYSITDGVNELIFEYKNGELVNFDINPPGDESGNIIDGMLFNLNADRKSYTLSKYTQEETDEKIDLVIPATYKNKPVTKIADLAFNSHNLEFESLTIPTSIIYIGTNLIKKIENLNYLGTVNQWVGITFKFNGFVSSAQNFYINGTLLTSANITATRINDWAFFGCKSLTSVSLCDNLEYVGANAFWMPSLSGTQYGNAYYVGTPSNPYKILLKAVSTEITEVELHEDTEIICGGAFISCTNLTSVSLNSKLNKIGYSSFDHCSALTQLIIPASVKAISSVIFGEYRRQEPIELIFENTNGWWQFNSDEYSSLSEGYEFIDFQERIVSFLMNSMSPSWLINID